MISDPLIGRVIDDKYRIEAEVGAGGMATIYRARRLKIGDAVAIKVLHGEYLREPKFAERFQLEAQAVARLKHPNVVTIHDFGVSSDGVIYLVMELVEGRNLRTIIKDDGPMPVAMAAEIVRQVCAALSEAHRQNTIHRDIKPANIAVTPSDEGLRVKVLDFGIASLRGGTMMTFTQTGAVLGTPAYMSPEQCLGEELDGRSDIYSLGVVLFEMLCGVVPFNSPTATVVIMQHVQQAPPPLRVLNASVPAAVEAVVLRALAKRREDRQQSAKEFADELAVAIGATAAPPRSFAPGPFSPSEALTMVQAPLNKGSAASPPGRSQAVAAIVGAVGALAMIAIAFVGYRLLFFQGQTGSAPVPKAALVQGAGRNSPSALATHGRTRPPVAAAISHRFAMTACGSILDSRTGLQWLVGPDINVTWGAAEVWTASLSACGGGWSMPSIEQLAALFDPNVSAGIGYFTRRAHWPAHLDPIFAAIGNGSWVWSRQAYADGTARSFNFNQNLPVVYGQDDTTVATRAFAVREGSRSLSEGAAVTSPTGTFSPEAVEGAWEIHEANIAYGLMVVWRGNAIVADRGTRLQLDVHKETVGGVAATPCEDGTHLRTALELTRSAQSAAYEEVNCYGHVFTGEVRVSSFAGDRRSFVGSFWHDGVNQGDFEARKL